MPNFEQFIEELSFEELTQLNRLITKAKLARKPRIVVDSAVKSLYQENRINVHVRTVKNLQWIRGAYRKKLGKQYLGYRIRQFNGVKWEVIEEAGDTTQFPDLDRLLTRI